MTKEVNVLMVEDDPFFRQLCMRSLEDAGFNVDLAPNGEKGIEKLEGGARPDIVLLDIILPKMNGFEVLGWIRNNKDPEIAQLPVIILSNLYAKEEEEKGRKLRASDYLIKANTNSEELVGKIEKVLSQSS